MAFWCRNFDEALRFAKDGVEDAWYNWLGLGAIVLMGVLPIVIMQRNRTKPLKKRREVHLSPQWRRRPFLLAHLLHCPTTTVGPAKPVKK
jgi:hypothetical protein